MATCRDSGLLAQSDGPKRLIGRCLTENLLATARSSLAFAESTMRYTIGTLLIATSAAGVLCAFAPALVILMCSAVPLLLFFAMRPRPRKRIVDLAIGLALLLPVYFFSEGLTELPRTYYLNKVSTPSEIANYNSWLETRDTLYWPYWTWVRSDAERAAQASPEMRAIAFSGFSSFLLWYHAEWGRYAEIAVFGHSTSDAPSEETSE